MSAPSRPNHPLARPRMSLEGRLPRMLPKSRNDRFRRDLAVRPGLGGGPLPSSLAPQVGRREGPVRVRDRSMARPVDPIRPSQGSPSRPARSRCSEPVLPGAVVGGDDQCDDREPEGGGERRPGLISSHALSMSRQAALGSTWNGNSDPGVVPYY
jgi:hypothetical protein